MRPKCHLSMRQLLGAFSWFHVSLRTLFFQLLCYIHSSMKAAVPAESYILFIFFRRHLYSPAMSTVSSQVGAALFPSF